MATNNKIVQTKWKNYEHFLFQVLQKKISVGHVLLIFLSTEIQYFRIRILFMCHLFYSSITLGPWVA
jgi:hypothetical protein